jgi:hypothetical protein
MFVNRKHKRVTHHHLWFHVTIFGHKTNPQTNLLSRTSSFSLYHHLSPWQKKARGVSSSLLLNLSTCWISSTTWSPLVIQIGRRSGKSIWLLIPRWSGPESLKHKFQELGCKKNPTGDPNCPPYVCKAKQISRKIVIATNGLTGGLSVEEESITSNEDGGGVT